MISKLISSFVSINVFLFILLFTSVLFPSLFDQMIYEAHKSKVFKITTINAQGSAVGGGTGFNLTNSKGVTYLITNKHVCKSLDSSISARNYNGEEFNLKIIKLSKKEDLCAIESTPDSPSFRLDSFYLITPHYALGYPANYQLQTSAGPVSGGVITTDYAEDASKDNCDFLGGKYESRVREFNHGLNKVKVKEERCLYSYKRIQTQIQIRPGSSGSPLINSLGGVVGLMSQVDAFGWGFAITSSNLTEFIEGI